MAAEDDSFRFSETAGGPVKLWCPLDSNGIPERSYYVFGADVSSGLGGSHTSNSVLSGINAKTGEQVLEYVINVEHPSLFTDKCLAIVKWFFNAYFAWEHQGPGYAMTARMVESGYGNVFKRRTYERRGRKSTEALGWWMTPSSKEKMFMDISPAVQQGEIVVRSKELVREFGQYVRQDGKIEHVNRSRATDDAKGAAHGDRVIAFLVAYQAILDRPLAKGPQGERWGDDGMPPQGTIARRLREYAESRNKKDDPWDRRTSRDLVLR